MLSSTANALLAWRTANFVNFGCFLTGLVGRDPRDPPPISLPPRPSATHDYQGLARLPSAAAVWSGWGQLWHATGTSRGQRRRRDPSKRVARSRNSTRRAYRASTPLATKGQLQRPVLVSTSAREAGPRASFQAREGLAVLVAEGRLDVCGRRGVEQLHSHSAAPTAKQAKNKPWSWPSAPHRSHRSPPRELPLH